MNDNQRIRFTYLTGKLSATLISPIEIATEHGLTKASHVTIEETDNGHLLKVTKSDPLLV